MKSKRDLIIVVSLILITLISLFFINSGIYDIKLGPKDKIDMARSSLISPGYYKFTLEDSPNIATLAHLESPNSNVQLVRRLTDKEFIGHLVTRGNLPAFISKSKNLEMSDKFDGSIDQISTKNYFLTDSLSNPGTKTCFITVRFFENYDFSYLWDSLNLKPVQERDNEYFFLIEPCDDEIIQSKITELVNRPEIESVRITPNFVTDLYEIGLASGAYNIHSGINPYNTPYTGEGMKIGFWDAGRPKDHIDFGNRIRSSQYGTFSGAIFEQYAQNHPTLVAGVLLGSGALWNQWWGGSVTPPYMIGVAPDAEGYSYDILDAAGEMLWAYEIYGIDVSSNSWHWVPLFAGGPGLAGGVGTHGGTSRMEYESRNFNRIAYDLEDLPIVFAAGNSRGYNSDLAQVGSVCDPENYYLEEEVEETIYEVGYFIDSDSSVHFSNYGVFIYFTVDPLQAPYQVYDLDVLENQIVNLEVGPSSTVNLRIYETEIMDQWDCLYPPSSAKNILTVGSTGIDGETSYFSSRGPTWDGRIKPDVVSLGEDIVTTDWNVGDTYTLQSPVSGTSFSTPTVAAHAVLLKQFLDDRAVQEVESYAGYESALIKAAFIHTATDIELPGPDYISGWGEINPQSAMTVLAGNTFVTDSFEDGNGQEVKKYPIKIPAWNQITEPLKITLVWNDYWDFAPTFQVPRDDLRELVNDLDLYLCDASGAAVIEKPFVLDWQNPGNPATREWNNRDNVEQVLATPSVLQGYITVNTQNLYACVRFSNYYNTPEVNQKFVLIMGDGSLGSNSYQATCGNGQFEPQYGEECDKVYNQYYFGGKTCGSFGGPGTVTNLLRCNAQCKIDGTLCESPMCGNGNLGLGEMCDESDATDGDTCALGCFGPEAGGASACKCMCTNDDECSGPGRGTMRCESGVCQGVGDGELDPNEECDPSSTTPVDVSCKNVHGYSPLGGAKWLCDKDGKCRDPNNLGSGNWWCPVGNKEIPNKPECTGNGDCAPGSICNNDCVCEANKKNLCLRAGVVKNVHPKTVECDDVTPCKDKSESCSADCQCVKKPKTVIPSSVSVICGDGIVHGGLSGEQCDPPGANCFYTDASGTHSGTCSLTCMCDGFF